MTTAQDGGKVFSLTHRPPLPPKIGLILISLKYNIEVKQSRYRPGEAQRVPGSLGSQIS